MRTAVVITAYTNPAGTQSVCLVVGDLLDYRTTVVLDIDTAVQLQKDLDEVLRHLEHEDLEQTHKLDSFLGRSQ